MKNTWSGAVLTLGLFLNTGLQAEEGQPGQKTYLRMCTTCHGKDGKAQTFMGKRLKVKDLSKSRVEDSIIKSQIANGSKDESGRQRMPSYKDSLSEQEIDHLVEIVKSFRPKSKSESESKSK